MTAFWEFMYTSLGLLLSALVILLVIKYFRKGGDSGEDQTVRRSQDRGI